MATENWSIREQLCLASCVLKNGDIQINWAAIAKQMKQICDDDRPSAFYTTKSCADQYFKLLESVVSKRKRTDPTSGSLDSSVMQIVSRLTTQRIEEIKRENQAEAQLYRKLEKEIKQLESGEFDDQLDSIYDQMLKDGEVIDEVGESDVETDAETTKEPIEILEKVEEKQAELTPMETEIPAMDFSGIPRLCPMEKANDSVQPPNQDERPKTPETNSNAETDVKLVLSPPPTVWSSPVKNVLQSPGFLPFSPTASVSASPLGIEVKMPLVSKSPPHSPYGVMVESVMSVQSSSESPPRVTVNEHRFKFDSPVKQVAEEETTAQPSVETLPDSVESVEEPPAVVVIESAEIPTLPGEVKVEVSDDIENKKSAEKSKSPEPVGRKLRSRSTRSSGRVSSDKLSEELLKVKVEESEDVSIVDKQRTKTRASSKDKPDTPSTRSSKRLIQVDDDSSNSSTVEDSATETSTPKAKVVDLTLKRPLTPVCPANFPSAEAYKQWKKGIMLVWKTVHNHKNSPTFLHAVEERNAPGYSDVVKCPMDLTTLRKRVENGQVVSNEQFYKEMLLIFVNAVMYNSSNHEVFAMAKDIAADFIKHMEEHLALKTSADSSKSLRHRTPKIELPDTDVTPKRRRGGTPDSAETPGIKRMRNI